MSYKSKKPRVGLKKTKRCPECHSIVKKIKGRNTYVCPNHGFISPTTFNKQESIKSSRRDFRLLQDAVRKIWR